MNDQNNRLPDDNEEVTTVKGTNGFYKKVTSMSAFIYLALAILVVTVATIGIFSISYDYEEVSIPEVSIPELNVNVKPDISVPVTPMPDTQVGTEQSGVEDDIVSEAPIVKFVHPIRGGSILKDYSMDKLVYSDTMGDYRVHSGVDIAADAGSEVYAYTAGTVLSVTEDYFYGLTVAVSHDWGTVSYYMNLDPALAAVSEGMEVKAGDVIGFVGTSARAESADESHLHFEMRVNGALIDPEPELEGLE